MQKNKQKQMYDKVGTPLKSLTRKPALKKELATHAFDTIKESIKKS